MPLLMKWFHYYPAIKTRASKTALKKPAPQRRHARERPAPLKSRALLDHVQPGHKPKPRSSARSAW